ncbi:MAG: flavodoxin family protein [Paramuribaculum sp.]|nr:flavodoxin family protein [Paramuribaculum sp.]
MKAIGINGSSRKDGNTAILINTVFSELNKVGIETGLIQLASYDIQPCRGCFACKGRQNCISSINHRPYPSATCRCNDRI